jgi:16S rRNA (uracil1498-N3)-methyltransferase
MPAERFFISADLSGTVSLEGPELHHLAHVMRIRVGEQVELVNGKGALAQAKLTALSKHTAILEVLSTSQSPIPPPTRLLGIPLMRLSKLELIVEKGTELGADAFLLYPAQYSDKEELSANQLERLHHIAISSMKQCGRLDLPSLRLLSRFEDLFTSPLLYLFGDTRPTATSIPPHDAVLFITGPEKGFSPTELNLLDQKAQGIHLHKNILRAETAPLAALCLLN